jgi:hypothetical protein
MADPGQTAALTSLLRVRTLALDTARQELAQRMDAEGLAELEAQAADQAIVTEMNLASSVDADDADVEAFARWLPRGRARLAAAQEAAERARADTVVARAGLAAAHSAARAVEDLLSQRHEEEYAEAAKREQAALDDRPHRPPPA